MSSQKAILSDEELALEAQAGSRRCYEELIERYGPKLFHFLQPKIASNQDIEDIIQETFFKLYKNIFRYDSQWKFSTWIYTAANRTAISFYRSRQKKNVSELPTFVDEDPADLLVQEAQTRNIWKHARNLKPDHHRVLWLRYVEEMPTKEIARVLRKTNTAVRLLLHRARQNLARQFQADPAFGRVVHEASPREKNLNYTENRG
jgi:RNA polymerase sigma-70 factor (ECF subfamily)